MVAAYWPRTIPVQAISVPRDAESVARGEHIALTTCAACHSADSTLPLSGGSNLSADTGLPLGDIYPPNLTPAGEIVTWSDGEVLRALREGTHATDRPLLGMPTNRLKNLSDADAYAVIAYLRSQPVVDRVAPRTNVSLLALALAGLGIIDTRADEVPGPVVAPPRAPDAAYGEYLVSYKDCRDCHGEAMDGAAVPPAPKGPPLFHIRGWTAEQFITTLRTGVNPDGHELQPPMPWKSYGSMDDVELTAVYEYLRAMPLPGAEEIADR
jgi:mono/diheme cytochrome c family protein